MKIVIIIASLIISVSIFLASGIYEFSSSRDGVANRYNKITGSVDFCVVGDGCTRFNKVD